MSRNQQRGFSLVELMVSITIGLVLLAGVMSIFFSSRVTYIANENTARLQESGRVALDFLTHDVRAAGYMGCARAVPFNTTLNNPTALLWDYSIPLQGFESDGAGAWAPALGAGTLDPAPINDSDVLVVRSLQRDGRALRVNFSLASLTSDPNVGAMAPQPYADGSVMMITDCNASSVFQMNSWNAGQLVHNVGGSTPPGNATTDLGYLYQVGARVAPLATYIYYVGTDPVTNLPGLYRQTGSTQPAELIIDGVQALQVAYGEDTNGDRIADQYVAADAVANWDRVLSVSMAMLVQSDESGTRTDVNTYPLLPAGIGGQTLGPFNDRRQRMVFTTTIALRNRAL